MAIKKILILGHGKIGGLLAHILTNLKFDIYIIDQVDIKDSPFKTFKVDLSKLDEAKKIIRDEKIDTIISCLPFHINKRISELAAELELNYFDPTEDVETTHHIQKISQNSKQIFMPQNGLAPGFIGILGNHLASLCDDGEAEHLRLRVGALPENPIGTLGYSCNWSIDGLINEYIQNSEIVENNKIITVPSLERVEQLKIEGVNYESFLTSGGVGTLLDDLKDRIKNINYKTIRYPGHLERIKFILNELKLKNNRELLREIFSNALPPNDSDRVLIHASVIGNFSKVKKTKTLTAIYPPKEVFGKEATAIAWTTAGSIAAIIEIFATERLKKEGFVELNDISLEDFLNTTTGKLFVTDEIKV